MKMHVLPGDSLVEPFKKTGIEGEMLVCRECLVDGDLRAKSLEKFWRVREVYLSKGTSKPDNFYREKVVSQFERLLQDDATEINLWFEYELFCQVHLWFVLNLLKDRDVDVFVVYPYLSNEKNIWKGFGWLDENDLKKSYEVRIKLSEEDVLLGTKLWKGFQNRDFEALSGLIETESKSFPTLKRVVEAAIEIETRPRKTLQKIIAGGETEFGKVFRKFNEIEEIYGFGDLQVKKIFDEITK